MRFINVRGVDVDDRVLTTKFSCDYAICKGACCNKPLPGVELNGGDLTAYEAAKILLNREELSKLCDATESEITARNPVMENDGVFYTTLHDSKCVLCNMKLGECALKIAERERVTDIGVPLSCQLYPLLLDVKDGRKILTIGDVFGEWCDCGYERGKRKNIFMIDFLKGAIIRGFGKSFYDKLKKLQNRYYGV